VIETAISVFELFLTTRGRTLSAGPIIEQGTHFCDLSRYFGGEVDISSVIAHSLEWYEDAGKLSGMVIDENKIEPENRIPRITSATWCVNRPWIRYLSWILLIDFHRKYESGAIGTFTHCVALKGHDYSCELEVFADGYQMK
jgi:predicted dehydrogenase